MEGKFILEHLKSGQLVEEHVFMNPISTEGENHIIDVGPSHLGYSNVPVPNEHSFRIADIQPMHSFVVTNGDKEAVIDFGGDSVKYSGDLPVDESARIFFEAVFLHWRR